MDHGQTALRTAFSTTNLHAETVASPAKKLEC